MKREFSSELEQKEKKESPSSAGQHKGMSQEELFLLFDDASGDVAIGDLEAAIEKYQRCVVSDPHFFEGWHALGMVLMKNGAYEEAIQAGLRATELSPNDQLAWSSLSLFYVRNHQIAEAEAAGVKARILSWGGKVAK